MRAHATRIALFAIVIGATACDRSGPREERWIPPHPEARNPAPTPTPDESPCEPGTVPASADFFPERIDLDPGETATITLYVERNGYCGPIEIAVPALPAGVHAELEPPASWPATTTTVRLTAADTLSDYIGHVRFYAWVGYVHAYDCTVRTRSAPEPNWTDEVVGIPRTELGGGSGIWVDEGRVVFGDIERDAPGQVTPVIRCIEPAGGLCTDYAAGGTLRLTPRNEGQGATGRALAPDGSLVIAEVTTEPAHVSKWGRVSAFGELISFDVDPVAINTAAEDLKVDSHGRILFLSRPTDWPGPNALVRLNADGTLDESFGEGGAVSVVGSLIGAKDVFVLQDGRILLDGHTYLAILDENGNPIGPPTSTSGYHERIMVLSDGSVLIGQFLGPDVGDRSGSVTLFDSTGHEQRRWELGALVHPLTFGLLGGEPVVVAEFDSSGLARIIRLPIDSGPELIEERQIGRGLGPATASDAGSFAVLGSREFRLPDGGAGWREVFVWKVE